MYKENNTKKKNIKALFLLIVLTVFGFVVFKFTKVKEISADTTQETEVASCASDVVDNSYEESPVFINLSGDNLLTGTSGKNQSVLGTMSCSGANKYSSDSACVIESSPSGTSSRGSTNFQGWVSSEAQIDISMITVPVRLLSGSYSPQDSNWKISLINPIYKSGGEQFDDKQLLVNTTPGEGNKAVTSSDIDNAVKGKPFTVKYSLSTEGATGDGGSTVSQYSSNNCPECKKDANINPDKSNKVAKRLKSYFYNTPKEEESGNQGTLEITGLCEDLKEVPIESDTKSCVSVWNVLKGTFGSLFPSSDWTSCSDEEDGCVKAEDIVVKMSPMFEETNSYMTTRNKSAMDPDTSKSHKPYYVVTSCSATVGGKLVGLKCLWDMSYLFEELKAAEYDDAGESDTPSETQYIKFLQEESTTRTDPLYTM